MCLQNTTGRNSLLSVTSSQAQIQIRAHFLLVVQAAGQPRPRRDALLAVSSDPQHPGSGKGNLTKDNFLIIFFFISRE